MDKVNQSRRSLASPIGPLQFHKDLPLSVRQAVEEHIDRINGGIEEWNNLTNRPHTPESHIVFFRTLPIFEEKECVSIWCRLDELNPKNTALLVNEIFDIQNSFSWLQSLIQQDEAVKVTLNKSPAVIEKTKKVLQSLIKSLPPQNFLQVLNESDKQLNKICSQSENGIKSNLESYLNAISNLPIIQVYQPFSSLQSKKEETIFIRELYIFLKFHFSQHFYKEITTLSNKIFNRKSGDEDIRSCVRDITLDLPKPLSREKFRRLNMLTQERKTP